MHALPKAPAWFRFHNNESVHVGAVEPGARAEDARYYDLGALDVHALLAQGGLRLRDLLSRIQKARSIAAPQRFATPVPRPGKILCVAKNYVKHAREFGADAPPEPIFFAKLPDTLRAHGEDVVVPHWLDSRVDHEAELGLVLGFADPKDAGRKYVSESEAPSLVAGYTIVNDVTARTLQGSDRDQKYPWLRSKSLDSFCPFGPFVVPSDAIDGNDLEISMTVNGAVRQKARTSEMVFSIGKVLAAMARCTTLRCGDLIATGTPEGVGPIVDGDSMAVSIEGLGTLRNPVRKELPPR